MIRMLPRDDFQIRTLPVTSFTPAFIRVLLAGTVARLPQFYGFFMPPPYLNLPQKFRVHYLQIRRCLFVFATVVFMVIIDDGVEAAQISTLEKNRCCPRIILLASRLWDSVNNGRFGQSGGVDAIGIDAEGNAIHIIIDPKHAAQYRQVLKEGEVYMFSNIGCVPAAFYRPVSRPERLRFNSGSHIDHVEDYNGIIKRHFFELQSYETAAGRLKDDTFLTDLLGVITKIEDPRNGWTKWGEGTRSKFYIQDLSGNEFPITLWGDLSLKFRDLQLLDSNVTSVIIVCSLGIRKYGDEIHASSMSPTKFFVNLALPEVAEYLARFEPMKIVPQLLIKASNSGVNPTTGPTVIETRTIEALLTGPSPDVKPGQKYNCTASIIRFEVDNKWFYTACKKCTRKIPHPDTNLGCQHCNLPTSESMPWYRLEVIVEDHSGSAMFTIFGKAGEQLLGVPATVLVNSPTMDPQIVHPLMERVIGSSKLFQVTLKPNTFGNGSSQIMVQNVYSLQSANKRSVPSYDTAYQVTADPVMKKLQLPLAKCETKLTDKSSGLQATWNSELATAENNKPYTGSVATANPENAAVPDSMLKPLLENLETPRFDRLDTTKEVNLREGLVNHLIEVDPPKQLSPLDEQKNVHSENETLLKDDRSTQENKTTDLDSVDSDELPLSALGKSEITIGKTFDLVKKKGRVNRKNENARS